jgi:hypothetical protein
LSSNRNTCISYPYTSIRFCPSRLNFIHPPSPAQASAHVLGVRRLNSLRQVRLLHTTPSARRRRAGGGLGETCDLLTSRAYCVYLGDCCTKCMWMLPSRQSWWADRWCGWLVILALAQVYVWFGTSARELQGCYRFRAAAEGFVSPCVGMGRLDGLQSGHCNISIYALRGRKGQRGCVANEGGRSNRFAAFCN